MRQTLPVALELMFGHEGGYSNVKTDSGGPTKYGITHKVLAAHRGKKSVTAAEVKSLTLAEATAIYVKSYWTQSGGDVLPVGLDYAVFDYGVNSGPSQAIKSLQRVVGSEIDGHIGEITLQKVREYSGGIKKLITDYCDERVRFLKTLGGSQGFSANGRGWTIRVTGKDPKGVYSAQLGVVGNALRMVMNTPVQASVTPPEATGDAKAPRENISITSILAKPEAIGLAGTAVASVTAAASGSVAIQYALAAVIVLGAVAALIYFVKRIRQG
jgi:lysozyme family protein